jgi:hypothetical protein
MKWIDNKVLLIHLKPLERRKSKVILIKKEMQNSPMPVNTCKKNNISTIRFLKS